MAEKHHCQPPARHRLCANNCGFFGSLATMNLCSKCFRDFRLKDQQQTSTISTIENALSSAVSPPLAVESILLLPVLTASEVAKDASSSATLPAGPAVTAAQPSRCATCLKRVGLTGFKCRCGTTFCGAHRYPEQHRCSFDFKAMGREDIARANPVIKAEKLENI